MWLVTERERELISRTGRVILRRLGELSASWRTAWDPSGVDPPPVDLPAMTAVAIERGVDDALHLQRLEAERLAAAGVPLDRIVSAVLLWEQVILGCLARDAEEDIFSGAAAFNRFLHGLVVFSSEAYSGIISMGRDEIRRGLEDADRLKTELVSMISHDLKTPLTTIEACAGELLKGGMEEEQRQRFLEMILHNAERLSRLISTILDVSRIEARAIDLRLGPLDLGEVAGPLVEGILPGTQVRLDLDPALPEVVADRQALERILVNLIDNAVRFSPEDEPVVVRGVREDGFVQLQVADRGPGIPVERRAGLFSKFYQLDPSPSARRSGTGLGLAIVRGLAESMGGEAGYRPNEPGGSVFWVRIPSVGETQRVAP